MDFEDFMGSLVEAVQGVDLSTICNIDSLTEILTSVGIDPSAFSPDQLEYMLQHLPHDALPGLSAKASEAPTTSDSQGQHVVDSIVAVLSTIWRKKQTPALRPAKGVCRPLSNR